MEDAELAWKSITATVVGTERNINTEGSHEDEVTDLSDLSYPSHELSTASHPSTTNSSHRFKRKNFNKELQLMCLQRYAEYGKQHGKLLDKKECELMLQQCYLKFVKEGGSIDEPRLNYQEFLKLIRNRRREMYIRNKKQNKMGDSSNSQALTPAKRKLQHEYAKLNEYLAIIDAVRENTGLLQDQDKQKIISNVGLHTHNGVKSTGEVPSFVDAQEQLNAIFRIQHEVMQVQREIFRRLHDIRLHPRIRQDNLEPSCASV